MRNKYDCAGIILSSMKYQLIVAIENGFPSSEINDVGAKSQVVVGDIFPLVQPPSTSRKILDCVISSQEIKNEVKIFHP